jgi:hypothetical protein
VDDFPHCQLSGREHQPHIEAAFESAAMVANRVPPDCLPTSFMLVRIPAS